MFGNFSHCRKKAWSSPLSAICRGNSRLPRLKQARKIPRQWQRQWLTCGSSSNSEHFLSDLQKWVMNFFVGLVLIVVSLTQALAQGGEWDLCTRWQREVEPRGGMSSQGLWMRGKFSEMALRFLMILAFINVVFLESGFSKGMNIFHELTVIVLECSGYLDIWISFAFWIARDLSQFRHPWAVAGHWHSQVVGNTEAWHRSWTSLDAYHACRATAHERGVDII